MTNNDNTLSMIRRWDSFSNRVSKATPSSDPVQATREDSNQENVDSHQLTAQPDIGTPKEEITNTNSDAPEETSTSGKISEIPTGADKILDNTQSTTEDDQDQKVNHSQNNHDWKKRYDDLRKLDTERVKQIKDLQKQVEELRNKPDLSKLKTPEEIETFREENPELAAVFDTIIHERVQKETEELKQHKLELEQKKFWDGLLELHPDALEIREDPSYVEWFNEQTSEIQAMVTSPNIRSVARAINMYKEDVGIKPKAPKKNLVEAAKKEEKAKNAMNVGSSSAGVDAAVLASQRKRVWKESEIKNLDLKKEWPLYEKEIMAAYARGEVIMDVTIKR